MKLMSFIVRLPKAQHVLLKAIAKRHYRSVASIVREALALWLKERDK